MDSIPVRMNAPLGKDAQAAGGLPLAGGTRRESGLGNTTKLTGEFSGGECTKPLKNQQVKEVVDAETGEINRFVWDAKRQEWSKDWDADEALLERWLLQQHAQRILSRPQFWQERDKLAPVPYTDLTARVSYTDLATRKVQRVLAVDIGLPRVRHRQEPLISGELFSELDGRLRSTGALNKAPKFRVVTCFRRKVPGGKAELWRAPETGNVTWHKVGVCGSVWTCPLCSAKINRARREEISAAYNAVSGVDGCSYMLTFTIKHGIGDDLGELVGKFKEAMQVLQKSRAFTDATRHQALKRPRPGSMPFLDYIGRIANLEVTHGLKNGWHPHEHHLWFFRRELKPGEVMKLRDRLFEAWASACVSVGLPAPRKTVRIGNTVRFLGLDIRKALSAQEYLTKFGQFTADGELRERRWGPEKELAGAHVKAARSKGSTPFQLLYDAAQGDKAAGQRFVEFATAFLGRHQLQFSRSLKAFLAELETAILLDDSEEGDRVLASQLDSQSELLAELTDHQFDKVVRNNAQGLVLVVARSQGLEAALQFIANLPREGVQRSP
ncbi:hypothetical protein D3C84_324730 [compost metagenome]